jgi:mono/diheme cytochrome c family protein
LRFITSVLRSGPVKTTLRIALVFFAFFVLVVPALAQESDALPSSARGQALARRWCAACHLVQLRLTAIDPPTFTAIANDPSKTPEYLRNFFVSPHKDMPPIQLTSPQIEDAIAYLQTLKKQ